MPFAGERQEVLIDMVAVNALRGILEPVVGDSPDPDGAVGEDQDAFGLQQAAPDRFGVKLRLEGVQPLPCRDVSAFGDDGAPRGGRTALVETEQGCGLDPVPALGLFALGGQLGRPAPRVPLPDVPRSPA